MTPRSSGREIAGLAAVLLLALAACSSDGEDQPQLLSQNSPTKDEDPAVVRAANGSIWVAWFSDRGGNPDIYLAYSSDQKKFSAPRRVTTDPGGDFAPSLYLDDNQRLHMAWFRWTAPNLGHIYYSYTDDGAHWSAEEQVTAAPSVDDWVPSITGFTNGALAIYFVSDLRDTTAGSDIYVTTKTLGGAWSTPVKPSLVNSPTENDHLPFAVRQPNDVVLTWVRNNPSALPWESTKADLWWSSSGDGVSFSPAERITTDPGNVVNVFPEIYQAPNGPNLLWLTTRRGNAEVVDMPLAGAGGFPVGLRELALPAGYSHRMVLASSPNRYFAVWVQGPEGSQDIYYEFFDRAP